MWVKFIFDDDSVHQESMGCFGNTGRVDWNGCNPKFRDAINKRSSELGITPVSYDNKVSRVKHWVKGVKYIQLDQGFEYLFHVRFREVLDYIVHRSIWAPLFDQSAEEIFKQNYIRTKTDVLPSEVQTVLHVWFRDSMSDLVFPQTFIELRKTLDNEHLAFFIALVFPNLATGQVESRIGKEGIGSSFNLCLIVEPSIDNLQLVPLTMREVHGYVMNLTQMWRTVNDAQVTVSSLQQRLSDNVRNYTVKGLFGPLTLWGLENPTQVVFNFCKSKGLIP